MTTKNFIRRKLNHGISVEQSGYMPPQNIYYHREKVNPSVGEVYLMPQKKLAIEYDGMIPEFLPVMVVKLYEHVVLMERRTKKRGNMKYAVDRWTFEHYALNVDNVDRYGDNFIGISITI